MYDKEETDVLHVKRDFSIGKTWLNIMKNYINIIKNAFLSYTLSGILELIVKLTRFSSEYNAPAEFKGRVLWMTKRLINNGYNILWIRKIWFEAVLWYKGNLLCVLCSVERYQHELVLQIELMIINYIMYFNANYNLIISVT